MDNVVRKRAGVLVCTILVVTTMLCSCRVVDSITNEINRKKEIETMAQQIMQCIVDENKEKLLTFFSSDIQRNHAQQIELELDRAFEFINGKIVSYKYNGIHGEYESINSGSIDFFGCSAEFCNVTTDTGFEYVVRLPFYYTWREKPEREGISMIAILDAKNFNNYVEVGFIYSDNE